jgi:hypothetical protein
MVTGLGLVRGEGLEVRTCVHDRRHKVTRLDLCAATSKEYVREQVVAGTRSQG